MDKSGRELVRVPARDAYEVGYAKPPVESRFKRGQSGNPKGRPKGARNVRPALHEERLKSIILEEAYRTIKVNDGDKQVPVPMAQAVVRSLAVTAAKGNTRAQRLFAELVATSETSARENHQEWVDTAINYKVEWERELERRQTLGIIALDPLPHPDDVHIDYRKNTIQIRGPMSKEEVRKLEHFLCRRAEFEEQMKWLVEDEGDPEIAHTPGFLSQEIAQTRRILEIINTIINQRASAACIKRLIDTRQITIDPGYCDPDME